ncbi:putative phosphomutase PMU1 [Talaromyces islandicus]|uniref:Putative phosphomutase PMU1 n=1 Tax=Talaromyces islandicus TaxID=28573 RepID=A0A0U1LRI6_TALIS|nr:putative phosphomutase PMU1 [Talaromyces islandicus]
MNYLHHPYTYGGHAGIPIEQPVGCGPPMAHPAMAGSMDGYLLARNPYDMIDYAHMPIMDDFEEYTENLSRPRLTKDQVDTLEAQFQAHPKPNSNTKRQLAVQTNLSLPRVANWFQNRRAKAKQQKRQEEFERIQREAAKKDDQGKPNDENATDEDARGRRTPLQEREQASTPKQPSASNDRHQTSARSATRQKHTKTGSDVTREKTFASLQRALNAAVAAREHFPNDSDGNTPTGRVELTLDAASANLSAPSSVSQNSVNAGPSEWDSRDSSLAWTPSQSPEENFGFGNLNAVPYSSSDDQLAAPHMENPQASDVTGSHSFSNFNSQAQSWAAQIQGKLDSLTELANTPADPMYGSMSYGSLQPPSESGTRRASSSEELAESIGNFGINTSLPPNRVDGPMWRRPEKEVDIAARRKRPRPAAIGTASRVGVGPSPMSANSTRLPSYGNSSHSLRHAKSSHALGSRYAGVRKMSVPQRSPLGFSTFADAAVGSESKHRLHTSASVGNLAPPTPLTPDDLQHMLPATPRDGTFDLTSQRLPEGQMFPTTQSMQINVNSPPETPLNMEMFGAVQYQGLAAPMSAPAQYATYAEYSPISNGPLSGVSWAVSTPDTSVFPVNLHASQPPPYVYEHDGDGNNSEIKWALGEDGSLFGSNKDSEAPPVTMAVGDDTNMTEFHIQEFPEQQEAHRSVAQQMPSQKPKNYTFSNQTPSNFNSPTSFNGAANGNAAWAAPQPYVNYSAVTGYFLQDEPDTDPTTFDYTAVNFGLINRTYPADTPWSIAKLTQWERFYREVERLNAQGFWDGIEYKVLFMGRHGEGWHNAAESYYGTPAWNCYWAELDGNSTASWSDARLTSNGLRQAQIAHDFWQSRQTLQRIHAPDAYFVSPLTRCLQTYNTTFHGLFDESKTRSPLVLESLREGISIHTCDHRANRSVIHAAWPDFRLESGFAECDELWNGVTAESSSSQDARSLRALNQIWSLLSGERSPFVSITSHSGEISSILRVLGHREFSLNTGAVIPVLVRSEAKKHQPTTTVLPWETSAHCTVPPVSSATTGCVCPSATPVTTPLVATGGCQ